MRRQTDKHRYAFPTQVVSKADCERRMVSPCKLRHREDPPHIDPEDFVERQVMYWEELKAKKHTQRYGQYMCSIYNIHDEWLTSSDENSIVNRVLFEHYLVGYGDEK